MCITHALAKTKHSNELQPKGLKLQTREVDKNTEYYIPSFPWTISLQSKHTMEMIRGNFSLLLIWIIHISLQP